MPQICRAANDASRMRIGMGTFIAISAEATAAQDALPGIEAAYAAIAQVERLMHSTRGGSDLLAIHEGGLGTFDPCLPGSAGRFEDLELALPHAVIPPAPLQVDLGGVAKSCAVDRAILALLKAFDARVTGCEFGS